MSCLQKSQCHLALSHTHNIIKIFLCKIISNFQAKIVLRDASHEQISSKYFQDVEIYCN